MRAGREGKCFIEQLMHLSILQDLEEVWFLDYYVFCQETETFCIGKDDVSVSQPTCWYIDWSECKEACPSQCTSQLSTKRRCPLWTCIQATGMSTTTTTTTQKPLPPTTVHPLTNRPLINTTSLPPPPAPETTLDVTTHEPDTTTTLATTTADDTAANDSHGPSTVSSSSAAPPPTTSPITAPITTPLEEASTAIAEPSKQEVEGPMVPDYLLWSYIQCEYFECSIQYEASKYCRLRDRACSLCDPDCKFTVRYAVS